MPSLQHTLILVPLRDREADWKALKTALVAHRPAGRRRVTLWAAEQLPGLPFNRGALLNAGFRDAVKTHPEIDEVLVHDVDTLPRSPSSYGAARPTCGVVIHHYGQPDSLGGVWSTDPQTYRRMGGHPHGVWGWGYEDSVMQARAAAVGVPVHKHADGGRSRFSTATHLRARAGSEGRFQEAKGIMALDATQMRQQLKGNGVQARSATRLEVCREVDAGDIDVVRVLYSLHKPPAAVQPVLLLAPASSSSSSSSSPSDALSLAQLCTGARLYGWSVANTGGGRPAVRAGVPLVMLADGRDGHGEPPPRPDALVLQYDAKRRALVGKTPLGAKSPPLRDFAALAAWVCKSTTVLTGRPLAPLAPSGTDDASVLDGDRDAEPATQPVWPDNWRIPLVGKRVEQPAPHGAPTSALAPTAAQHWVLSFLVVFVLVILGVSIWAVTAAGA